MIAGKFNGQFPPQLFVEGRNLNGTITRLTINAESNQYIPLHRVFVKTRLDILTAQAWLEDSKDLREKVVEISCNENMPSAHTTMVAYEKDPAKVEDEKQKDSKTKTKSKVTFARMEMMGRVDRKYF